MLKFLSKYITYSGMHQDKIEKIFTTLDKKYPTGFDAFGLNIKEAKKSIKILNFLYENYFKVRVFGQENVKEQHYMAVANHSGQIAIDAVLVGCAFTLGVNPPRLARPLVERFFGSIPFVGTWATQLGAVLGDRQNCIRLLERKETVLVFPEGVRGVAKSTPQFYKLQNFSHGFLRMAIKTKSDILPIAVVGAEEFYPYVFQAKKLAKKFGLPALPLSLNYFPLPSPVDIHFGVPYKIPEDLTEDAPDSEIDIHIQKIERQIQSMIKEGLKNRRHFFGIEKRKIDD